LLKRFSSGLLEYLPKGTKEPLKRARHFPFGTFGSTELDRLAAGICYTVMRHYIYTIKGWPVVEVEPRDEVVRQWTCRECCGRDLEAKSAVRNRRRLPKSAD